MAQKILRVGLRGQNRGFYRVKVGQKKNHHRSAWGLTTLIPINTNFNEVSTEIPDSYRRGRDTIKRHGCHFVVDAHRAKNGLYVNLSLCRFVNQRRKWLLYLGGTTGDRYLDWARKQMLPKPKFILAAIEYIIQEMDELDFNLWLSTCDSVKIAKQKA